MQFQPEEADRVRAAAEARGLSQSAYVRMLVMSRVQVPSWWAKSFDAPGMTVQAIRSGGAYRMHREPPDFILEMLYETQSGGAAYKVFDANGMPLTFEDLRNMEFVFRELHRGRVMLGGSHMLWQIVRSVQDINLGGQLIWLLDRDTRKDSDAASS